MKVLLTGASGFIGSVVLDKLIDRNHSVIAFVRNKSSIKVNDYIQVIEGDITDTDSVNKACQGVDVVVHLAAAMTGDETYQQHVTIKGTENILMACHTSGIKQLIYISTINVYASNSYQDNAVVDESFQLEDNPEYRGAYSNTKLKAEAIVLNDKETISTVIRPGLVYGKNNIISADVAIPVYKNIYVYPGSGHRKLPMVYVGNLADAIVTASETRAVTTQAYNIVDSELPSQREVISIYNDYSDKALLAIPMSNMLFKLLIILADFLFKMIGKNKHIKYRAYTFMVSPLFYSSKFESDYNWKPKTSMINAFKEILG